MTFKSKKISTLILGVSSLVCSRVMFLFIDDPEGPNLLIVVVLAMVLYFLSLTIYKLGFSIPKFNPVLAALTNHKRLITIVVIQILLATTFYFCLH